MNHLSLFRYSLLTLIALALMACGPASNTTTSAEPTRTPRPTFTPTPIPAAQVPAVQPQPTPQPPVEQPPVQPEAPDPEPEPEPAQPAEPPAPAIPEAVVTNDAANLRTGPGTNYPLAGTVNRGSQFEIIGKNPAGDWWQVCCVNGQSAWVAAFLVDTSGPVDGVAVAQNIPAPPPPPAAPPPPPAQQPAPPPAQPAPEPEPEQPPAPTFPLQRGPQVDGRPNSNPIVSFFGWICKERFPCSPSVGGYVLVIDGPSGTFRGNFGEATLDGDPGLASAYWYNVKVEVPGGAPGVYRAYVTDGGGNQVSEAWEYTVSGDIRTFLPRWLLP